MMDDLLLYMGTDRSYAQLSAMVSSARLLVAKWREFPGGIARELVIASEQEFRLFIAKIRLGANELPRFYARIVT